MPSRLFLTPSLEESPSARSPLTTMSSNISSVPMYNEDDV